MSEPTRHTDPSAATEPVEVQRYGPTAGGRAPQPSPWHAAPAWSSRPAAAPSPARRSGMSAMAVVGTAVVAGIVSGALSAAAVSNALRPATDGDGTVTTPDGTAVSQVRIDESSAVINAVEQVAPAVVTIIAQAGGIFSGGSGTGSGFIYDSDGWILTNRHVVADAEQLTVVLDDTRQLPATVIGIDTLTDLAIIKVEATDLPVAPVGTSAELEPGQLAIAIGNPLGDYENTVTTGVVSGLGREILASDATQTSAETLRNLIQTDAAINPGNSGGPLVNSAGQVIGINTAVSTNAQGLGFAIPIDVAKPIMEQAVNGEELTRPWIGVFYTPVTPQIATERGLSVDHGALVSSSVEGRPGVIANSPAEAAGILEGDLIVAVDGTQVDEKHDLATLILPHAPGDTITLRVLRDSSVREIPVTLGELQPQP
jgi:S1-C subfamily serine protease